MWTECTGRSAHSRDDDRFSINTSNIIKIFDDVIHKKLSCRRRPGPSAIAEVLVYHVIEYFDKSLKSLEMAISVLYGPILYHFPDKARY